MTTLAGVVTKGMADPSSSGPLAKANAQDSNPGGFARALGDAGDDSSGSSAAAEANEQGQSASVAGGQSGTARFSALSGLASLGPQQLETNPPAVQPGAQPPQTLVAAQVSVLQPDGLQADSQAVGQGEGNVPANLDGQETASVALDLAKLAGAVKRPGAVSPEGAKERADTSPNSDAAADSSADTAASASSTQLTASAEALLQLVANAPLNAADTPATVGSSQADRAVAGLTADAGSPVMPGNADDLDPTSDVRSGGDAAVPSNAATFRFQKSGDAAVAVSLSITKGENGGAELQDSVDDLQKPETVTVLDSRRYLGFGMGSNASNLLSAASGDREWSAAMHPASSLSNAASASSTGHVVNTLKLQLTPDHLGTVTANMRLQGDELSIHLTVHNAAAYRELSGDSRPMLEALRAQGFNVDQVTVSLSSSSDPNANSSSGQPQANSNSQAQQQHLQRDGEAGRQQGQGQGQSSSRAALNDTETLNETAQAPVRAGGGAGNLYL